MLPPRDLLEPAAIDPRNGMGILADETCVELLADTPIGRLAYEVDGHPMVLPVTYAWYEDSVVFRTLAGQKLEAATAGQRVCFQIDHWDSAARIGWSVAVVGSARAVTNFAEREQLENIGLVPWSREKWRQDWVRIDVEAITGRLLR